MSIAKNYLNSFIIPNIAQLTRRYKLQRIPGMERALRLLYNPNTRQNDFIEIVMHYDYPLLINVNTSNYLEWYIFFFGQYEPTIINLIKRIFKPGFVAFDVGANAGCHTLIMGFLAGEQGKIFAIEPHPENFQRLMDNIGLNRLKNIVPLRCALSDSCGQAKIYSPVIQCSNKGASSLIIDNIRDYGKYEEIHCDLKKLDDIVKENGIERLDFIKIDTEGNDYKVLTGALESIKKYKPYIIFEWNEKAWENAKCNFADVKLLFSELDYSCYIIETGYLKKINDTIPKNAEIFAMPQMD